MSEHIDYPPLVIFVDEIKDIKVENHVNTTIVYVDMSIQTALEPQERTFTFIFSPEQMALMSQTMKQYYRKR